MTIRLDAEGFARCESCGGRSYFASNLLDDGTCRDCGGQFTITKSRTEEAFDAYALAAAAAKDMGLGPDVAKEWGHAAYVAIMSGNPYLAGPRS